MSNDAINVTKRVAPAVTAAQRPEDTARKTAASQASQSQQAQREPAPDQLRLATEQLEAYLRTANRSLEFRVDEASGHTVVTVRDTQTGDVIRQMPSEEVLRLAQMAQGDRARLLNETV